MSFLIFISSGFCSFWFLGLKRTSIYLFMKPRLWTIFCDLRMETGDWLFLRSQCFSFSFFSLGYCLLVVIFSEMGSSSGEAKSNGIDASVGGLVWVRRRNGSWWPGRIMGIDELSEGSLVSPRSGTPVKLLGREDASVWVLFPVLSLAFPTCLPWLCIGFFILLRLSRYFLGWFGFRFELLVTFSFDSLQREKLLAFCFLLSVSAIIFIFIFHWVSGFFLIMIELEC